MKILKLVEFPWQIELDDVVAPHDGPPRLKPGYIS